MKYKEIHSSLGGTGWLHREEPHSADIRCSRNWHRTSNCSEYLNLREVTLADPGSLIFPTKSPNTHLMLRIPSIDKLTQQFVAIKDLYSDLGIKCHIVSDESFMSPNFIFQRDLFFSTSDGIILSRPASQQRASESVSMQLALAKLNICIRGTFHKDGTFEGADALWFDNESVVIGIGRRTNRTAFNQIKQILSEMKYNVIAVKLTQGFQHLLGAINFLDEKLAVISERAPRDLFTIARKLDITLIELPFDKEFTQRRSMNFVTVAPRKIVINKGCFNLKKRLEAYGVEFYEADVSEYIECGGGLGCLTGIVRRDLY